jgi:hypothetical protein
LPITNFSDVAALVAILSFAGGIVMFLFKKIVIEPLKNSIDSLNRTIEGFKETAERRMDSIEVRVDSVEDRISRHDEQIRTLFSFENKGGY